MVGLIDDDDRGDPFFKGKIVDRVLYELKVVYLSGCRFRPEGGSQKAVEFLYGEGGKA